MSIARNSSLVPLAAALAVRSTQEESSDAKAGVSFFEFQVRYDKGGSEMEFGMCRAQLTMWEPNCVLAARWTDRQRGATTPGM